MSATARCGVCEDEVGSREMGLQCDRCDAWFHATCQSVKKTHYRLLKSSPQPWLCTPCLKVFRGELVKAAKVDCLEREVEGLRQRLAAVLARGGTKVQAKVGAAADAEVASCHKVVNSVTGATASQAVPTPAVRRVSESVSRTAVAPFPKSTVPSSLPPALSSRSRSKSSLSIGIESRIQGIRREVDREVGNNVGIGSDRESGWQVARSKGGSNRKDRARVLVDIPMDNRFRVLEKGKEGGNGEARQEASILSSPELVVIGD